MVGGQKAKGRTKCATATDGNGRKEKSETPLFLIENNETSTDGTSQFRVGPEAIGDDPSPQDAAAIVEELEAVMTGLDETQRRILELSLQDMSESEISAEVQRSGRTVRRTLLQIRSDLENRLKDN